jgi:hypothetical protein
MRSATEAEGVHAATSGSAASGGAVTGFGLSFRLMAAFATFLALSQLSCIALGLGRVVLSQGAATAIVVVAALAGLGQFVWLPRAAVAAGKTGAERFGLASLLGVGAGVVALAIHVCSWVAALAKPDMSWDGNAYHVATVHFWVRRGYIHWIDAAPRSSLWSYQLDWLFNAYPKGVETTAFLATRLAASSRPVNACNLVFLPLGVLGVVCLARTLGASRRSAMAVGAALGLIPLGVSQGITTYVDASLAYCVIALCATTLVVISELARHRVPWRLLAALGLAIGLAASAKSSGLAPAALAVLVSAAVAGRGALRLRGRERRSLMRQGLAFVAGASAIAALSCGYWYGRTFLHTGNPIWPVHVGVFGHTVFAGRAVGAAVSEVGVTPAFMREWPGWVRVLYTWTQGALYGRWPAAIRYYDAREGGLGYLWLLGCMPSVGLVAARIVRRDRGALLFAALAVLVGVSFVVTPLNWWSRYTLGVYALGLPALAVALDAVGRLRAPVARLLLGVWLTGCFALACFEALYAFWHSQALSPGYLERAPRGDVSSPSGFLAALLDYDRAGWFYNLSPLEVEAVTRQDGVAVGDLAVAERGVLGVIAMPLGARELAFVSPEDAWSPARMRELAQSGHFRYVFWHDYGPVPEGLSRVAVRGSHNVPRHWFLFDLGPVPPAPSAPVWAK